MSFYFPPEEEGYLATQMFPFENKEAYIQELRKTGTADSHLLHGNFFEAIKMYTSIIQEFGPENFKNFYNRALAYLELGMYKRALKDFNKVLEMKPDNKDAIYRKIKCLNGLGRHQEAMDVFKSKLPAEELANEEENENDQDLLESLENYMAHSRGEYNILQMMDLHENESLDVIGEYNGPIKVVLIPGKGRGVIATADIAPGQVITVTKAFAMVFGVWPPSAENDRLVETILQKLLLADKKTRTKFRKLSTWHEEKPTELSDFNWGAPFDSQDMESLRWEIQTRINSNRFVNNEISPRAAGIWISEVSYLNNDCIDGNVSKMYFGDKIMLRAFKQIKKGEELTIPYTNPEETFTRNLLFKRHNFECKCRLCEFEKSECIVAKFVIEDYLKSISEELHTINKNKDPMLVKKIMEKFRRICEIKSNKLDLNMDMKSEVILFLGEKLFGSGFIEESMEVFQAIRKAACNPSGIKKGLFEMDKMLIKCCLALGDRNEIISAVKTYKEDLVSVYGAADVVELFGQDILRALEDSELQLNFHDI